MIEKEELKRVLVDILKDTDINVDINSINDDTILIGEDGLFYDSIDVLELIVELENRFKIKVKDNDIIKERFKTFSSFYQFVLENMP